MELRPVSIDSRTTAALRLLLLTTSLLGCATKPEIGYDPASAPEIGIDLAAARDINTITILTPRLPQRVSVFEGGGSSGPGTFPLPGSSGGSGLGGVNSAGGGLIIAGAVAAIALGAAVADEAVEASRENRLMALLEQRRFSAEELLVQRLTNDLRAQGYEVTQLSVQRPNADFLEEAILEESQTSTNADAVLDLVVQEFGYWANSLENGHWIYRPRLVAKVQMVDAENAALMIRRSVAYMAVGVDATSRPPRLGPILIEPDDVFQIVDFDTLESNPDLAVNGLREAVSQSADAVSRELVREEYPDRFYVASPEQDRIAKLFAPTKSTCKIYVAYQSELGLLESGLEQLDGEPRWLYEDGRAIGLAHPGYYSIITLEPGSHEISFAQDTTFTSSFAKQNFNCRDGEILYLKTEYKRRGSLRQFGYELSLQNENDGQLAILRSRLLRNPRKIEMTENGPVFRFQN